MAARRKEAPEDVAAREKMAEKLEAFGSVVEAVSGLELSDRKLVLRAAWAFAIGDIPGEGL